MDKILNMSDNNEAQAVFTFDELIFEEVVDEERSMIRVEDDGDGNYNQLEEDLIPEIRLKEDLHSLLIAAVCELKEKI